MALTGIQIYKLLPKTNCGECGVPTCLAFAMNLAAGKAELAGCPYVSEEAKAELADASAPPIAVVEIGTGERKLKIGGETVLFRHEKTFVNPPGIAVLVTDEMSDEEVAGRLERLKTLEYERVGLILRADLVAVKSLSGDAGKFEALVTRVKNQTDAGIILMAEDTSVMESGLKICSDRKPLMYAATKENADGMASLAKEHGCSLAVKGDGLDEVSDLTTKLTEGGLKNLVIDSGARAIKKAFEDQIIIRRAALLKKYRPLGFPTITLPFEMTNDSMQEALIASMFVAKYGGIIVLSDLQGHSLFPLLLARMNIYTDPQRPMATSPGIYEIGGPNENSPVLVTCNFSLTYFIVSGEIETSRVPAWLVVVDTEGLSVLTAWAAGKFVGDAVGMSFKKCGIMDKVSHKKVIIPGYAAAISGDLEEELGDWEVLVGPRESAHIPAYLKEWKA
ncbi:MAG: acetyl-CoA decarbonylase/synthase complex subunit gamma [Deltaproteobacteria bacterium]|nr:acetyl-CoA decarbonylase/synthase complex subunit gamma [Deltaproteobacteria bacterium]MBW2073363.1 acetyl-CoA decarbonylase/synthase complex subunit gamma [Deltaproteobacteria bacterium]RLB83222.1 MAG: acetyl-CoA decarbonylase/synthase complex subunit gamma [Deltaproteobacteria bacterium]